ncbi:hypothetical protein [Streptomyces sp. NPDC002845]
MHLAGYIEDRWLKKRPNPKTGKRERTAMYGKCTRYRVKGIPSVKDRSFDTLQDAKTWLAQAQTDARRGEFVVWEPSREHGYHALRHFYASEQLEAGESVGSLARWLGHSDPGFTLRKYAHFLPRAGARGSAAIDAVFA